MKKSFIVDFNTYVSVGDQFFVFYVFSMAQGGLKVVFAPLEVSALKTLDPTTVFDDFKLRAVLKTAFGAGRIVLFLKPDGKGHHIRSGHRRFPPRVIYRQKRIQINRGRIKKMDISP